MDDIFLTGDDNVKLKRLEKKLVDNFEIRDLGALKYFLGMEFARSKKSIFVDQHKYLLNLVVGMQSS
jgi:acid phosphatase class B